MSYRWHVSPLSLSLGPTVIIKLHFTILIQITTFKVTRTNHLKVFHQVHIYTTKLRKKVKKGLL